MKTTRIKQGNVTPIWRVGVQSFDADGEAIVGQYEDLSVNYECHIEVETASTPIVRQVTRLSSDSKRFLVQLDSDDTTLMAKGKHTLAIEVRNSTTTPPFVVEEHISIVVDDDIID